MTPARLRRRDAIAWGLLLGLALGVLAGLAEGLLSGGRSILRVMYVLAWDAWLGALWGLLASLPPVLIQELRSRGSARVVALVVTVTGFPVLAAALGLIANRVLLSGTHFLSRVSLLADVAAIVAAALLAFGAGRLAGPLVEGRRAPRLFPVLAGLLLGAVILVAPRFVSDRGSARRDLPTVVIVSIDTLRPDRLGTGGFPEPTSPMIDRLCRQGLQFTQALAVSPGSAASHAALFSSRYPVSNGVWANFSVMDEDVVTAAELARDRGYRTGGFATNTFLGRRFHFDQGFDTYVESGQVERLGEPAPAALFRGLALVQIVDRLRVRLQPGYDPSFETAIRWLAESRGGVFAFVHLMDVHSPYAPPHPWGPRFGAHPSGDPSARENRNRFGWRPSEEAYAAEVRFADTKIERLVRALEETGRLDDCVLLITSDHGENLLDHEPHYSHGQTLYESTLRILAAVWGPSHGLEPGLEGSVLENVDLLPTLATLLGWERHPDWEGVSFLPRAPAREDTTFGQLNRDFAVRTPDRKLVLREDGGCDYFLLDTDPGERGSALLSPSARRTFEDHLARWLAAHTTELYEDRATSVDPGELTPELRAKLRALGYVK